MAYQELTKTPTAVAGLVDGTSYQGEVKSTSVVFFLPSATVPSADTNEAASVRPTDVDRRFEIEKTAGEELYVWAGDGPEPLGVLQYNEA